MWGLGDLGHSPFNGVFQTVSSAHIRQFHWNTFDSFMGYIRQIHGHTFDIGVHSPV